MMLTILLAARYPRIRHAIMTTTYDCHDFYDLHDLHDLHDDPRPLFAMEHTSRSSGNCLPLSLLGFPPPLALLSSLALLLALSHPLRTWRPRQPLSLLGLRLPIQTLSLRGLSTSLDPHCLYASTPASGTLPSCLLYLYLYLYLRTLLMRIPHHFFVPTSMSPRFVPPIRFCTLPPSCRRILLFILDFYVVWCEQLR